VTVFYLTIIGRHCLAARSTYQRIPYNSFECPETRRNGGGKWQPKYAKWNVSVLANA